LYHNHTSIYTVLRPTGYLYERLDGNTRASDRNDAVKRFGNPSFDRFIMLLSTKAGEREEEERKGEGRERNGRGRADTI
jgi:hypothetical protein